MFAALPSYIACVEDDGGLLIDVGEMRRHSRDQIELVTRKGSNLELCHCHVEANFYLLSNDN